MPGDVKIGLLLAAGVVLFCGSKRISLQTDPNGKGEAVVAQSSTTPRVDVRLPSELKNEAERAKKDLASTASQAKNSAQQATQKGSDALAKLSPKDLREKVNATKDQADDAIADLELPSEIADSSPKSKSPVPSPKKEQAKTDQAKPTSSRGAPEKVDDIELDLPPVRTTDVTRVRENQRTKGPATSKAPKTNAELAPLDLPANEPRSSGLSPSSDSSPIGSKPSRLPSPADDEPKPLPGADEFGSVGGKGPVHPYFQRFLRDGSYFVRDGESLREIAFNLYQDESKAAAIVSANKDVLRSAGDLKPGMKLRLP